MHPTPSPLCVLSATCLLLPLSCVAARSNWSACRTPAALRLDPSSWQHRQQVRVLCGVWVCWRICTQNMQASTKQETKSTAEGDPLGRDTMHRDDSFKSKPAWCVWGARFAGCRRGLLHRVAPGPQHNHQHAVADLAAFNEHEAACRTLVRQVGLQQTVLPYCCTTWSSRSHHFAVIIHHHAFAVM